MILELTVFVCRSCLSSCCWSDSVVDQIPLLIRSRYWSDPVIDQIPLLNRSPYWSSHYWSDPVIDQIPLLNRSRYWSDPIIDQIPLLIIAILWTGPTFKQSPLLDRGYSWTLERAHCETLHYITRNLLPKIKTSSQSIITLFILSFFKTQFSAATSPCWPPFFRITTLHNLQIHSIRRPSTWKTK